jgi:hypothetical protein
MKLAVRIFLAALAATALFASLAASAAARNFSLTNRNIRVVWEASRPLEFISNAGTVRCRVTIEGSFHCATVSKVVEALIGYISRATAAQETCVDSGGNSNSIEVVQSSLPWHIRYASFSGTLPRIRVTDRLVGVTINLLNVPVIGTCRYSGSGRSILGGPLGGEITEGNTTITAEEGIEIRSETFGCENARFRSPPVPVLLLGTTNGIRVRLT